MTYRDGIWGLSGRKRTVGDAGQAPIQEPGEAVPMGHWYQDLVLRRLDQRPQVLPGFVIP